MQRAPEVGRTGCSMQCRDCRRWAASSHSGQRSPRHRSAPLGVPASQFADACSAHGKLKGRCVCSICQKAVNLAASRVTTWSDLAPVSRHRPLCTAILGERQAASVSSRKRTHEQRNKLNRTMARGYYAIREQRRREAFVRCDRPARQLNVVARRASRLHMSPRSASEQ
jgi:hypothetical protein